jgi:hypothetical protein
MRLHNHLSCVGVNGGESRSTTLVYGWEDEKHEPVRRGNGKGMLEIRGGSTSLKVEEHVFSVFRQAQSLML